MLHNYILALLVLAAGYHVHGTITKTNHGLTFTERLTNLLERKCLQNSVPIEHEKVSKQFDHLKNCFTLSIGPEGISDDKLTTLCHEQAENFLQCLTTLAEQIEPCLDPEEIFLKQLIIDVYNTSSKYLCSQIEFLNTDQLLKTNTVKCITTLQETPEINPQLVCFENSTIIGDNPTEEMLTKEEVCFDILHTNVCYSDILEKHCPDAPEVQRIQKGLLAAMIDNCIPVLFRGTVPFEEATEATKI